MKGLIKFVEGGHETPKKVKIQDIAIYKYKEGGI